MRTEPVAIIEGVRLLALVAGLFGIVLTVEEQAAIVAGIGGFIGLVSVGLAIYNRRKVYSQETHDREVRKAARVPTPGEHFG